ncbi:hypothetical protein [Aurantiacibacter luteus]|uniref:Uncharacterized protein n=1 Tax=Aurantiacibacter luteus TaxID=1581420 RepID=A0A0G9MVZ3_9SPHN|nr:hypothetical protein [Aurantiacibacter luteus]KLE34896.1 hypothetical protein AAW00_10315 [Aurantiacibacter luteus]
MTLFPLRPVLIAGMIAVSSAGVATPAIAQEAPRLSLEQRMLVRCSAAFAIVARGQEAGDATMRAYPDLRLRGREFFVQASARVMDEAGLGREAVAAALGAEARDIRDNGTLAQVMPACLPLLPAA